eukprot:666793-Amphidinium_carterae.1
MAAAVSANMLDMAALLLFWGGALWSARNTRETVMHSSLARLLWWQSRHTQSGFTWPPPAKILLSSSSAILNCLTVRCSLLSSVGRRADESASRAEVEYQQPRGNCHQADALLDL